MSDSRAVRDLLPPSTGGPRRRFGVVAPRLLLVLAVVGMVAVSFAAPTAISLVTMFLLGATIVVVAFARYGWRLTVTYLVMTFIVANVFENLSISTGFPFGHYHYPGTSLRIIDFPVMIGVLYCLLGLICWLTASALLDGADLRLARRGAGRRIEVVALPALAAALMALYDLGSDSAASTLSHSWVWEQGGGVFGVPLVNYLGWWFVTYVFFQIFALVLATRPTEVQPTVQGREPLAIATAAYFLLGAAGLTRYLTASADAVVDLAGVSWDPRAMTETLLAINIFGTVLIAALAAVKLLRNDVARYAAPAPTA